MLEARAPSPDLQFEWSPCHLPPQSLIDQATEPERLWAVQKVLKAFSFESVTDLLLTELCVAGSAVGRRASKLFKTTECVDLLKALTQHPKFSIQDMLAREDFCSFAKVFFGDVCDREFQNLVHSPKLQCQLYDFTPSQFENIEIFREIQHAQEAEAPILSSVIQKLARVDIGRKDEPDLPAPISDITDGRVQEKVQKALRNRRLISIVALQLIAYAHSKNCNLLQGILGVYLYAANTPKQTIETLHQFGLSCGYDAILRGLRLVIFS